MPVNLKEANDIEHFGNKAFRLFEVVQNGFVIPSGFVIPHHELENDKMSITHDDCMEKLMIWIKQELAKIDSELFAVRSSSSAEDGLILSFAGAFESVINVPRIEITRNIVRCYQSVFSSRTAHYLESSQYIDSTRPLRMSIIVQEMIIGEVSGVAFSVNPVTGNRNEIIIEAANWLCEQVVSWKVTPHRITHLKGNTAMLAEWVTNAVMLDQQKWSTLVNTITDLERICDYPVDIEWTFRGNQLYVLQLRPITSLERFSQVLTSNKEGVCKLSWEIANGGTAEGVVIFASGDEEDYEKDFTGKILIAEETTPSLLPFMMQAEAILTAKGWILSHAAIVSRELNKPCVVGITNLLEQLKDWMMVRVDANSGNIYIM